MVSLHAVGALRPSSGRLALRQNAAPVAVWEKLELKAMHYGHSIMGDYHSDSRLVSGLGNPVFKEYHAALEKREPEYNRLDKESDS